MPAEPASRYICSAASTQRDEPMLATASAVRGWLLVEVRGAWGDDAIHTSAFGEHVPPRWKDELKRRRMRAVCIRSHLRADATDVRLYACVARRPGRDAATLWSTSVGSLADVVPAAEALAASEPADAGWEHVQQPLFLVCTNGRHDQCCANLGRPLIRALRDTPWGERVWECSHIGGDRFAPNLVALPESLYFGRLHVETAPRLLGALDDSRLDLSLFRGRTTYSLLEQAVEHFVRHELGVDTVHGVVVERRADDGSFPVTVSERTLHVRVRRRMVSTPDPLTCKGRGDQLVPQFELVSIE